MKNLKSQGYRLSLIYGLMFILMSLFVFSCAEEVELVPSISGPCFADENGNCDDDPGPIDPGPGPGNTVSLPTRFQYFHRGENTSKIYSSYSSTGIGGWTGDFALNSNAELEDSNIDVARFGDKIAAFHEAQSSNAIFYSTSRNARSFTRDKAIPNGASTNGNIKAVGFDDKLFVYYHGVNNDRIYYSYTANDITWVGNSFISLTQEYRGFDLIVYNKVLYLIAITLDDILFYSSTNGINFTLAASYPLDTDSGLYKNVSVTEDEGIIYILGERKPSGSANRDLMLAKWNPSDIGSTAFKQFHRFRTIRGPRFPDPFDAYTSQPASIATDGNKLVVVFQSDFDYVLAAYNTEFDEIPFNQNIGPFQSREASGKTNLSGLEVVYIE